MFNLGGIRQEMNPFFEIDVMFGTGKDPSFVSIILDKKEYSVSISLNEPESDYADVSTEDDVEILKVKFKNLNEPTKYYNNVRHPINIAKIVINYKNKEGVLKTP